MGTGRLCWRSTLAKKLLPRYNLSLRTQGWREHGCHLLADEITHQSISERDRDVDRPSENPAGMQPGLDFLYQAAALLA